MLIPFMHVRFVICLKKIMIIFLARVVLLHQFYPKLLRGGDIANITSDTTCVRLHWAFIIE